MIVTLAKKINQHITFVSFSSRRSANTELVSLIDKIEPAWKDKIMSVYNKISFQTICTFENQKIRAND